MIWGCCYNNLPHTWNFTHNLKNSEEATFHYYLKLCLVSEPGHWVIIFFIKASNYLMNSMIILHLGVYFGWRYSFIKCKHLMLTLTLYKKKKCWRKLISARGTSLSCSSQDGPVPFTGWLVQEILVGGTAWANETEEFYWRWDRPGSWDPLLQCYSAYTWTHLFLSDKETIWD